MGNTKKKIKVNTDRIMFLYKYRNITQAELARRVFEQKTGQVFSEKYNKNYIIDFNKLIKSGEMMRQDVQAISQVLDCHPDYILGKINEKVEDVAPLLFKLSEAEYVTRYLSNDPSPHAWYMELKSLYLADDEGYYVPPYREYEYEEQESLNMQDFKRWLLSINMFGNPDFLTGFPSNDVLESILSNMDRGTMEALQAHLIECVLDHLTEEGYIQNVDDEPTEIIDYSKLSEEEIDRLEEEENKEWIKKREEGLELYRKRKGELNDAESK